MHSLRLSWKAACVTWRTEIPTKAAQVVAVLYEPTREDLPPASLSQDNLNGRSSDNGHLLETAKAAT